MGSVCSPDEEDLLKRSRAVHLLFLQPTAFSCTDVFLCCVFFLFVYFVIVLSGDSKKKKFFLISAFLWGSQSVAEGERVRRGIEFAHFCLCASVYAALRS